jgi:hypothetical protein
MGLMPFLYLARLVSLVKASSGHQVQMALMG